MHKFYIFLSLSFLFTIGIHAQYDEGPLFPDLEGEELYDAIVDKYKPYYILNYDMARDTLFKNVYQEGDSLYCIYTRHALYMDPDKDPSTYAYRNGSGDGINTEHVYPRSKGAMYGNAKSNMHSLFPCKANVNSIRSNFPLGDMADSEAELWFYKSTQQRYIPTTNKEEYAKSRTGLFEPRDSSKGPVARAMLYFYTMYTDEADEADDLFFGVQREDFCKWHDMYPVDSLEYARTYLISEYQDGMVNPFVIDCTLAGRLYCDDIPQSCTLTASKDADISLYNIVLLGNPVQGNNIEVQLESPEAGYWSVDMINTLGQKVQHNTLDNPLTYGRWSIAKNNLPKGIYFLRFSFKKTPSGKSLQLPTQKVILQ